MNVIGPGSEWFWAAAQFVLVAVSLLGIYRQLKAQGSANAMQRLSTLHDRWNSERLIRARLKLAIALRHGAGDGLAPLLGPITDFFEDIALLEASGHVSRREIWIDWNRTIEFWWGVLEPEIRKQRAQYPGEFARFEGLAERMVELDRRSGQVNTFDSDTVRRTLDDVIEGLTASLRLEVEARAGDLPAIPPSSAA